MPKNYSKKVFPDGLRLIHVPLPKSFATTVLVLVAAGSEYEDKKISGSSHFLEHLSFKGTKKRPNSQEISTALDSLGAEYNAFTGNEMTGYFAKTANKNFSQALEIVSDLYLNPLIDSGEMEKERGVILEEINMYEDLPKEKVKEDFDGLLYGDQPAGRSVLGTKETIKKISREEIVDYRGRHYVAGKTVVVVAGGATGNIEEMVKENFSGIEAKEKIKKIPTREFQDKPALTIRQKGTDQAHIILGVRAFNLFDPRRYAMGILSTILGGTMSSRLFYRIREQMGAAYYIYSSAHLASDYGYLAVCGGVDKERINESSLAILEEMRKLTEEKISPAELKKARESLSGRLVLRLETSDDMAGFYGGEELLTEKIIEPEEELKKIQAVTAEEVMSLSAYLFRKEKLNMAFLGTNAEEEKLRKILEAGLPA